MLDKPPKRPRDPSQLAKHIIGIATGELGDYPPTPEEEGKNPAAVKRGRLGGLKGGRARAEKMPPAERKAAAERAAKVRWSRP